MTAIPTTSEAIDDLCTGDDPCMRHGAPFIRDAAVRRIPHLPCAECEQAPSILLAGRFVFERKRAVWVDEDTISTGVAWVWRYIGELH